jgi:hypothetical protein
MSINPDHSPTSEHELRYLSQQQTTQSDQAQLLILTFQVNPSIFHLTPPSLPSSPVSTALTAPATMTSTAPEVFATNPFSANINPSSTNGLKLYQSATAPRPDAEMISTTIAAQKQFLNSSKWPSSLMLFYISTYQLDTFLTLTTSQSQSTVS